MNKVDELNKFFKFIDSLIESEYTYEDVIAKLDTYDGFAILYDIAENYSLLYDPVEKKMIIFEGIDEVNFEILIDSLDDNLKEIMLFNLHLFG